MSRQEHFLVHPKARGAVLFPFSKALPEIASIFTLLTFESPNPAVDKESSS